MTEPPMIHLSITLPAVRNARLLVPLGLATPHSAPVGLAAQGGSWRLIGDPHSAQQALLLDPEAAAITLRWRYITNGAAYPEALFARRDSRFTRAAAALGDEAAGIARGDGGVAALATHVAGLFRYGHVARAFYDGHDEIPQLCGLTVGSCVDINAYFIAACRAAGIEAGYVTGYFFPEEKRDHCTDMHCWVITRVNGIVREWDIAHHLKIGAAEVAPGLNPKPGVRVAMAHSMGLSFPELGRRDLKLLAEPMWLGNDGSIARADLTITLAGYDLLARCRD